MLGKSISFEDETQEPGTRNQSRDQGRERGDQLPTRSIEMAPIAISPERDSALSTSSLSTTYDDTLRFYLNGTRVVLDEIDPEITLLEYLRGIGLTGTKL